MPTIGSDGKEHHTYDERAVYRAATLAAYFAKREMYTEAVAAMALGTRTDHDTEDGDIAEFLLALERGDLV